MLQGMTTSAPLHEHGQRFVPGVTKAAFECLLKVFKSHRFPLHITTTTDVFYPDNVRRCVETGVTICKQRLRDLDYTNPASAYDFRLSVSSEDECKAPAAHTPVVKMRKKFRTSFAVSKLWQLDMTVVTSGTDTTYEVELELRDLGQALDECAKGRTAKLKNVLLLAVQSIEELAKLASTTEPKPAPEAAAAAASGAVIDYKAMRVKAEAAMSAALKALHASHDPKDSVWKAWGNAPEHLLNDT
jgi:hypothetical protein